MPWYGMHAPPVLESLVGTLRSYFWQGLLLLAGDFASSGGLCI